MILARLTNVPDRTMAEVFPADDRAALFVVSMGMAANDIRFAMDGARAAINENSSDPIAPGRVGFWHRLINAFLFEGLDSLSGWEKEEEIKTLLLKLPPNGKEALKKVRGLRQATGPAALKTMRHQTFHYPHPDSGRKPDSSERLSAVLRGLSAWEIDVDAGTDIDHSYPAADLVAFWLAFQGHHHDLFGSEFAGQMRDLHDGAVAFFMFVRHVFLLFLKERGIDTDAALTAP
jgi:hypothetical protein